MKKYTLHLISFKQRIVNDKKRREITEVTFHDEITFELAKFLAIKEGCKMIFFDKKNKLCLKDSAISAVGYACYFTEGTIAIINPKIRIRNLKSDISIYPELNKVTLNKKVIDWRRFDLLLDEHKDNFFDCSIEAFHIWGPNALIPKGYEQITEGFVMDGDYYFNENHWVNTNVSFTPIKIGATIKETGIIWSGKQTGREENESLKYYNQFVIRKISKPV